MLSKIFIVLLFLLFSQLMAQSQIAAPEKLAQMSIIGKPEKLESEIVTKKDANGRFCAGIKVVSDMDGFRYDAYNGVVDMKDNPGEDMVYIQPDERVLEIYHSGYEPLKIILLEIGIQLNPRDVWKIKIKGAPQAADLLPVSILIKPQGAELFINNKKMEGMPPYSLTKGTHTIRISKMNYKSHEQSITVDEKNVLFNITLKEVEDIGVQIETVPSGAEVYIDGLMFGATPISKFYPEGSYPIQIKKEGYLTLNETIEVKPPLTRKSFTLVENVGYLKVNTHQSASVYMDGKKIEANKEIKVTPRIARIRVTMQKAIPIEKQVAIKKNEHVQVDLFPFFPKGTIQVAVTPFDAKIVLKGDAGEYYSANETKVFKDIPTGTYKLGVSKRGFKTHSETIRLAENEKVQRTIKLEKGYSSKPYSSTKKKPTYSTKRRKPARSSYFGLQVGVGFANERKMEDLKVESNVGVQYGMFFNAKLSGLLSLQAELNVFQRKMELIYEYVSPYDGTTTEFKFSSKSSILQIPLLLKINFSSFSLYAGPSYNYFGTLEYEYEGETNKVDIKRWELSYPMGLALYVGKFVIDLRYEYGSKFFGSDSDEFTTDNNKSLRSDLFILLGYRF